MTKKNKEDAVQNELLPWFAKHSRDLPWRKKRTPYRVWVSEIMLQQTRVDTVIDYYNRWMKKFPSWRALARAPQGDVLKAWEGLGYYSRARNLHAASKIISEELNGRVPCAVADLQKFPGIGNYTAAAVASLAFNQDAAVLDGNVIRVLSRLFAYGGDVKSTTGKKKLQAWADDLLVPGRAGEFNESMMELGALVCLPVAPKCADCPLQSACEAFGKGAPEKYPVGTKKKKIPHITVGAAVTVNSKGEVLIAQRLEGDMLGGLWEFPGGKQEPGETIEECIARELKEELGINTEVGDFLMTVKHVYSHFKMTMHVYCTKIRSGRPRPIHCADFRWVKIPDLGTFAYSKADLQVVGKLQGK
ncbi:A/G-specific adenine glycosylase [Tichowtungia aerotolerans]|uniref:Adenine DNA glycosylase n=1 Tax=Tichowtungia aerotolerans TaxID=2697043 RepID=A0A6P1M6V2_9BACT|nr:A/G-specific adenine glycosylase [Tichowtungia aerotolerans]QHI69581.1 A/G-specific adenine glycosylase [Tichowtungia aerotolerans]